MMKRVLVCVMVLFVSVVSFFGCKNNDSNQDVIRIHIRANSNNQNDQDVKLKVRDNVIDYITPIIANCEDSHDVKITLEYNLENIEEVANNVLMDNGFLYKSTAKICNEYFPTRKYDEKVFPADYYDALILNLGSGVGDNWWCVAYPPLCFVGEDNGGTEIVYKSKILELINKFFGEGV